MNRLILIGFLIVGLRSFAFAAPQQTFQNDSVITSAAQIPLDVVNFINRGYISVSTDYAFETFDTLNFTNKSGTFGSSGTMIGSPGFWFNNNSYISGFRRWSANFFNDNNAQIRAEDPLLSQNFVQRAIIGESLLRIWATNIVVKSGSPGSPATAGTRASLVVGANGMLDIEGGKVDLSRSGLEVLPVWNESSGSANFIDDGTFAPDIAVDDLAAITGSFSSALNNRLNTAALWNGQIAQSLNAPPFGNPTVSGFVLTAPESDFYYAADPQSFGFVVLTNFTVSFSTNNFVPTATNVVPVTNIVVIPASYFAMNQIFSTNFYSTNFQVGLLVTNVVATFTNSFSFTNVFFPTNAFDTTNIVVTTNRFILGNVFTANEIQNGIPIYSNVVKGAFFGEAPAGFVISHGFGAFGEVGGRTIQATVSGLFSNAVTGLSDVASVFVQDTLGATTDRGLLNNLITGFPPEPATTRPVNYLVSRGGLYTGVIIGTNTVGTLTNIIGNTISRPPAANFFLTSGIQDPNNLLFYDNTGSTSFDSTTNPVVQAGDYSGYSAYFDNLVQREFNSPFANETNRTGRVLINADRLNLDRTRIRGEGLVTINTPHLISSTNTVIDCESLSFDLASTNGTVRLQNLSKDYVNRLRGSITVWSAVWSNSVTVVFSENYTLTNGTTTITNMVGTNEVVRTNLIVQRVPLTNTIGVLYHTMMLDARGLTETVPVTVYDLALRSRNAFVDDNATVTRSLYIGGQSLTINGNLSLYSLINGTSSTTYGNWFGTNAPNLAFFTNNGFLYVSGEAHFGDDRESPYAAFVNNGFLDAYSVHLNSTYFENPGSIYTLGGVLEMRGGTGSLVGGLSDSSADTTFFARNLSFADYSAFSAGAINFYVTNHLGDSGVDFPSSLDATNGFNLWIKPATGDLLGTTFVSHAPDVPAAQPQHTWGAEDRGASPSGYIDNAAIGALILMPEPSVTVTDPLFVFRGAGIHNAMYVDFLDLSNLTDYTNQLSIDSSLTIYFAAASLSFTPPDDTNGVPQTPEEYLNGQFGGRLQWVSAFAGPNSSTTVTIDGQSVVVNSGLANQWSNNGIDPSTVLHLAPITIEINGNGVVSPYTNAQNLIIGQTNTIVAVPNSGATFLGWTGTYESSSPQLTFVADNDVVLIANFSFTPIAASYNGLFYTTNAVEFLKSGAISITTTKGGKYSGSVQYGAKKYSFTGILDEAGADGRSIPNSPLFLEFQTGTDHVTGTIGDGDWLADLYLDRAVYNAKTNPAPFQGHYTLLFPGSGSVTNTELPFGDGYGTVRVDAAGKVRLTGSLADGTKVSQSSVVSGDRHWPLYIPLYKGQGQLLSWQTVLDTGDKDIGGDYSWIKPPDDRSKVYSGGFAFQTNAFGSFYNSALSPLTGFEDALVILSGGDLMTNLQTGVFVTNKVYAVGTNKFTMTLSIPTGTFKGVTLNPATGKPINFTGAVLQKQGYGSGYFLGTNQTSGKVTVIPTP